MMMPVRIRQRIARISALMLSFGSGFAWATTATVQSAPELTSLPWIQIAVGAAISSWGGATATLGRYLAAEYEQRHFYWRVEVVRDVVVSVTVGAGSYLAGAWWGLGSLILGVILLLSGYSGVRLLTLASDIWVATVKAQK